MTERMVAPFRLLLLLRQPGLEMTSAGCEIIVVHGSDSEDDDSIVNEVLNAAPVSRRARQAARGIVWPPPPKIPRVSDERSDKHKPDPSPVTVRPIKVVRPNKTARELFGLENATPVGVVSTNAAWDAYVESPIRLDGKAMHEEGAQAGVATDTRPHPSTGVLARRTRVCKTSTTTTVPAPWTQSTPEDDSDSDYSDRVMPQNKPYAGRRKPPQEIQLRPMFDSYMALVWRQNHYSHERMRKPPRDQFADEIPSNDAVPTSSHLIRRPLRTLTAVPDHYRGNHLVPAKWPATVPRLAANFNPTSIRFPGRYPSGLCGCDAEDLGDCRFNTCKNAEDGIFCDVYCCPFNGKCGNGRRESTSVRLMQVRDTEELALQATARIEEGVAIGEYLGELSLETGVRSERANNEGYRLHFHRDPDAWGSAEVCVNALLAGSLMRFLNHSCSGAVVFREVGNGRQRSIVATTVRVIHAGEEITANYGNDLWFKCICSKCT